MAGKIRVKVQKKSHQINKRKRRSTLKREKTILQKAKSASIRGKKRRLFKGRKKVSIKSRKKRLTKRELKEFKKILLDLREEIIREIEHINKEARSNLRDSSGDLSSHTFHMADIADENFAKELNLELASNEREILRAINQSLYRIETGEYGICFDCKGLIPKSRLRVIPYTLLCRKCQEEREKRMGSF